jgi:hypothetical protein
MPIVPKNFSPPKPCSGFNPIAHVYREQNAEAISTLGLSTDPTQHHHKTTLLDTSF